MTGQAHEDADIGAKLQTIQPTMDVSIITTEIIDNVKQLPMGTCNGELLATKATVISSGPAITRPGEGGAGPSPAPVPSPSPAPVLSPSPAPVPSSGGECKNGHVQSQANGACVERPWDDFAGCAEEAEMGICEEAIEWVSEHCCISCGSCSTPPTSSWTPVDGGEGRVCRGASVQDNLPEHYVVPSGAFSLAACESRCEETPRCQGIEHKSTGRCEIWTRPQGIQASKRSLGFTCLRFGSTTTTASQAFEPVDGGSNRVCRGFNSQDNSPSYYTVHSGLSLEACKRKCMSRAGCRGIEHKETGRCEIWTRSGGIQASRPVAGFSCYRYGTQSVVKEEGLVQEVRAATRSRRQAFLGTAFLQHGTKSSTASSARYKEL